MQSLNSSGFFVVNLGCRLLLAVALGKTFAPDEYGIYVLIATVVSMTTLLLPLDVSQYYQREVPGRPSGEGATIFKSVVVMQTLILAALLTSASLIPGLQQLAAEKLGIPGQPWVISLIAGIILAESLANDFVRYLYARREIERGNEVAFLQGGLWTLFAFAVYWMAPERVTLSLIISLWLLSICLAVGYGFWRSGPTELWRVPVRPALYLAALRFGAPITTARLGLAMDWVARFLLVWFYSETAVGTYSYSYGLILMIAGITSPIGGAMEPYAVASFNQGDHLRTGTLFSASLRYRIMVLMPFLLVAVTASQELISLLARPEYAVSNALMAFLAPVPILVMISTMLERVLYLERRITVMVRGYVVSSVIQLGLYALLVPVHPYYGTAAARTLGAAALVGIFLYDTRSAPFKINVPYGRLTLAAVPCMVVAWAVSLVQVLPGPWRLALGIVACCGVFAMCVGVLRLIPPSEARTLRDAVRQAAGRIAPMLLSGRSSKATHL